ILQLVAVRRVGRPTVDPAACACPTCSLQGPRHKENKSDTRDTGRKSRTTRQSTSSANSSETPPFVGRCPRRKKRLWRGNRADTAALRALVSIAYDCWCTCLRCRTRLRWKMKHENVPYAYRHGNHTFRGSHNELNAACKRLDRACVEY